MTGRSTSGVAELERALAAEPRRGSIAVDGCDVRWLVWGDDRKRTVLFVHGGAAHSWWWSFTVPTLADDYHVVAMDLSGHGDSGHRAKYSFEQWAVEVNAVLDAVSGEHPPVIVGHSMGGIVTAMAAARRRRRPGGLVLVDAPLSNARGEDFNDEHHLLGRVRYYPTEDDVITRFRLVPPQEAAADELVAHIARKSVRFDAAGGGWSWKFDPAIFVERPADRPGELWTFLRRVRCPISVVVATESPVVIPPDRAWLAAQQAPDDRAAGFAVDHRFIDGGHHLMVDRPIELMTTVRDVVSQWTQRPATRHRSERRGI